MVYNRTHYSRRNFQENVFVNNQGTSDSSAMNYPVVDLYSLSFQAQLQPRNIEKVESCLSIGVESITDKRSSAGTPFIPYCEVERQFSCNMVCEVPELTDHGKVIDGEDIVNHYQFWVLTLIVTVVWFSMAIIGSLSETLCFGLLGDHPSKFGKQRLWGSFGWGLTSFISGVLVDVFSEDKAKKDYNVLFIMCSVLLVVCAIASLFIKETERVHSTSIMLDVGRLLLNIKTIMYVVWCIVMGIFNGLLGKFLFWHIEDLTDCDGLPLIKTIEGLFAALQSFCGELPFFFLNSWILEKMGHVNAMSVTLCLYSGMCLLFSVLNNPIHFLPIALLNGVSFGTMYSTLASYASILAPPGTEGTIQGLVGSLYEGLGVSLGTFIGGLLMGYLKGAETFRIFGLVGFVLSVLHIIFQHVLRKSQGSDLEQSVSCYTLQKKLQNCRLIFNIVQNKVSSVFK